MTEQNNIFNIRSIILSILNHQNSISEYSRLEYLVYLLKQQQLESAKQIKFDFNQCGPYSNEIDSEFEFLIKGKFIKIEKLSEKMNRVYSLDFSHPEASTYSLSAEDSKKIMEMVICTKYLDNQTLCLAASSVYLENKLEISREDAMEQAILQNHDAEEFQAEAEYLLNRIGLGKKLYVVK
jgi:hypothetical protein